MAHSKRWGGVALLFLLLELVSYSSARAQVFSSPLNVSNNSDISVSAQIALDSSGSIFVVWEDDTDFNSNILFSRSTDGGVTFSSPTDISKSSGFAFGAHLAVDALGGLNVVWVDDNSGTFDVSFSRSTDHGVTFSAPKILSNDSSVSARPQVAVDSSGNIFVAWEEDTVAPGIRFTRSLDAGATFSSPITISTNTGGSFSPQIAVDTGGAINVVWEDDSGAASDISFSRSSDHGATFSLSRSLSLGVGNSHNAQIAVDLSGNINVVWENDSPGNFDIFFARSADGGLNFSAPKNLSNSSGFSRMAQIGVDLDGNITAAWMDDPPSSSTPDIYFARSTDAGAVFSTPQNLSNNTGFSSNPRLLVEPGGNINLAWEDTTPGNHDIFFSRSADAGKTFATPTNLSKNSGTSSIAQMAEDSAGNINLVWQDDTPGFSQIFFSRLSSGVTNHAPVANAGPDQTVQATGPAGASVQLDGSKSSDPDGDTLTYIWTDELNNVVGNLSVIQLTVPVGTHAFTLTVTDPGGLSSSASTHVTVTAVNHPPVANAGPSQTFNCGGANGTAVTLDGSASSDPDGDALTFVWKDATGNVVGTASIVQLTLPAGTYTFTLTVTDPGGLSSSATTQVTIQNSAPPTLQLSLSPDSLWPPNHRLVQITALVSASSACSANPTIRLVAITSSEPDNGLGDGDQPNDIQAIGGGPVAFGTNVTSFLLRAERSGMGPGRVYTVTYSAADAAGNTTSASASVVVSDPASVSGSFLKDRRNNQGKSRNRHDSGKEQNRDRDKDKGDQ